MNDVTTGAKAPSHSGVPKGLTPDVFGSILGEAINWIAFPAYPPQAEELKYEQSSQS
jgi:hypothetical protein